MLDYHVSKPDSGETYRKVELWSLCWIDVFLTVCSEGHIDPEAGPGTAACCTERINQQLLASLLPVFTVLGIFVSEFAVFTRRVPAVCTPEEQKIIFGSMNNNN